MSDIFISYASEDRSRVKPLAKALEEQGWSVWWDRTIPPGKTFDQVIEEAIKAARCVVVLWSERSIKSDWVKEEANIAKERKILVPAKIDPVDLPLGFGRIQAADLTDWEAEASHPGLLSLLNAISEVAGPPPKRDKSVQDTKLPESNLEQQLEVKSKETETFQPDLGDLKPVEKESPITGPKRPGKKRLAYGIGAVALILVLSVIGWFLFSKPALYTITASSGPNGSISPTGEMQVTQGDSKSFKITPSPGYRIAEVTVDNKPEGAVSQYTFKNVTSEHSILASFVVNTYIIKASSGPNGKISPAGSVSVSHGDSKTFKITPSPGYRIADVKVDGRSVGAVSGYSFKDITSDSRIEASFAKIVYTITASSGPNGKISPAGSVSVSHGESKSFKITPDSCYRIADVKVDGRSVGAVSGYSFKDITSDSRIEASFSIKPLTNRKNLALKKLGAKATQSTTRHGARAERAIDGNRDGNFWHHSVTHTEDRDDSWWQLELPLPARIEGIVIWNRTDPCCRKRLSNLHISVLNDSRKEVWSKDFRGPIKDGDFERFTVDPPECGRFVKVEIVGKNLENQGVLSLAEVQVLGEFFK